MMIPHAPENSDLTEGQDVFQDDGRLMHLSENVEVSLQRARRKNFVRMLVMPVLLSGVFVMTVLVGHDLFVKHSQLSHMRQLAGYVQGYQEEYHRLPLSIDSKEAGALSDYISLEGVTYDATRVLPGSPADTVLAYTVMRKLRILHPGYAVLSLDGQVNWIDEDLLEKKIKERDRFYYGKILQQMKTPGG